MVVIITMMLIMLLLMIMLRTDFHPLRCSRPWRDRAPGVLAPLACAPCVLAPLAHPVPPSPWTLRLERTLPRWCDTLPLCVLSPLPCLFVSFSLFVLSPFVCFVSCPLFVLSPFHVLFVLSPFVCFVSASHKFCNLQPAVNCQPSYCWGNS